MDRSSLLRQVLLGGVVFAATLLLLVGLSGVVGRGGGGAASASTGAPAGTATPAASVPPMASATVSVAGVPSGSPRPSPGTTATPSTTAPTPTPAVSSAPTGDPVLVGAGDIADCTTTGDTATARLIDGIAGTVFTAGDNVYAAASAAAFRDCYDPTWGRFKARTRPAAGNHDWLGGGITAYKAYFGDAAAGPEGATWYAYDLGTWRIIVLDSDCGSVDGCGPDSPQGRWLASQLAADQATCTLAIWHHPRFSSGQHGNDKDVAPFWQALYAAGADVVINGHDHDYERFAPQDPNGRIDVERGLREFVVGTGGTTLRGFSKPVPNSELRASVDNGVIALTLHPDSYEWVFQGATTDFSDRGTARCHG